MRFDDDQYATDHNGNRVLVGLCPEESRELEQLDDFVGAIDPLAPCDESQGAKEERWLFLFRKHSETFELFAEAAKTKH